MSTPLERMRFPSEGVPHASRTGGKPLPMPGATLSERLRDACPAHPQPFIDGCLGADEASRTPCISSGHPLPRHRPCGGQGFGFAGGAGVLGFFFG